MWRNELEKFEFDMKELRVFDVFAGIGALHKSLNKLGIRTKITNISEIDVDATISYASIHIDNFKDLEFKYPSDEEMKKWLIDRNIGYSYEKDKSSVPRMKRNKLKLAYKASCILKNLGDISKINYRDIEDFDMMNFSFSCTDLSGAGEMKGMKNEDGTLTRSGMYVYGINVIRTKKPKYIMIENVKGLIQRKFIDDFYSIINELEEMGYNCYYPTKEVKKEFVPTCLNSKNYGIPQNRERIFVYAIRKDIDDKTFEFDYGYDKGIRLKHILEDYVDPKYYLSDEIQTVANYKQTKQIIESTNELNMLGMLNIKGNECIRRFYSKEGISPTLTTMEGGNRQPKIEDDFKVRKLTPLECWRLQGFDDDDFYKAKELGISDSQLYKQAGNSITVNVPHSQFKQLFKKYILK